MNTPKPFCFDKSNIKAFVLGADPTNDKEIEFEYVFGINSGDRRYFSGIEKNLNALGLTINDVYVQNLISVYLEKATAKNKDWEKYAKEWLPIAIAEFHKVDPTHKIPVLVTAERIMKFLYPNAPSAKEIYEGRVEVPFSENLLGRPMFAFYRHMDYSLIRKHEVYKIKIIDYLG